MAANCRAMWNAFYAPAMASLNSLRSAWFPPPGEESAAYAAKHRVAADVRAITERLVGLDVEAVPDADLAELEAAAARLRGIVEALPDRRRFGSLAGAPLPDGALVERSPVSGRGNALAMPLHYEFGDSNTSAWCVFSAAYEGPPGGVHGGYVAAAFDEVLGVTQMTTGLAGFTGRLTVRYHRLTPIEQRIDFTAEAGPRDGRKLTMRAEARAGGELVADAEGLFIAKVRVDTSDENLWVRDP
jgi:hypothetical protein